MQVHPNAAAAIAAALAEIAGRQDNPLPQARRTSISRRRRRLSRRS